MAGVTRGLWTIKKTEYHSVSNDYLRLMLVGPNRMMKKKCFAIVFSLSISLVVLANDQEFKTIKFQQSDKTARDFPVPDLLLPTPHLGDGEYIRFFQRREQKAGFTPEWRDSFVNLEPKEFEEWFPSIAKLPAEQRAQFHNLNEKTGYGDQLTSYFPGDFVNFLKGKALAFVLDDLQEAGYEANDDKSVQRGLLKLFHIVVDIPGYEFELPERGTLQMYFIEHDTNEVIDISINMVEDPPGFYYFEDAEEVYECFSVLDTKFGEVKGENRLGRELKFVSLHGFDESNVIVDDIPSIEGVVLTHEIFFGEWAATAGWQWFGRPLGLYQSLEHGFVRP